MDSKDRILLSLRARVAKVRSGELERDPIAIRVNETTVALRRREANAILAEPVS